MQLKKAAQFLRVKQLVDKMIVFLLKQELASAAFYP